VVQQLHVQVTISFTGPDAIALGERSLSEKKFFFQGSQFLSTQSTKP
jgi:hypothetical protein